MASLADLRAKVAANTSVTAGAITLIRGLKQRLDEAIAQNDPVALQALSDELDSSQEQLAAAILANTVPGTSPSPSGGGEPPGANPPEEEPPPAAPLAP